MMRTPAGSSSWPASSADSSESSRPASSAGTPLHLVGGGDAAGAAARQASPRVSSQDGATAQPAADRHWRTAADRALVVVSRPRRDLASPLPVPSPTARPDAGPPA